MATDKPRPTLPVVRGWVREIMGLLYVIHNRRLLHRLDSFRRNAGSVPVDLIRFGGHLLKGRYDVHDGRDSEPAPPSAFHG